MIGGEHIQVRRNLAVIVRRLSQSAGRPQATADSPVADRFLCRRDGAPIWSVLMQTLDVVDWFLLAGAVVYFGLLLARRI
jgi:hypothetical protein